MMLAAVTLLLLLACFAGGGDAAATCDVASLPDYFGYLDTLLYNFAEEPLSVLVVGAAAAPARAAECARAARRRFAEHFHAFRVWAQTLTGPQLRRSDLSAL